jgi:4'-phosphopantetheinyl transferase EntD
LRGAPQWPPGVVGSITHCAGYRASAVARDRDVVTVGLDAEPHDDLPSGVLGAVASAREQARLAALAAARPDVCWDRMLFSAKESVYKAWFPLTRRWLNFEDASVDIDPVGRTFTARLMVDGPVVNGAALTGFDGRWLVRDGLIVTAIVIPRAVIGLRPYRRIPLRSSPPNRSGPSGNPDARAAATPDRARPGSRPWQSGQAGY